MRSPDHLNRFELPFGPPTAVNQDSNLGFKVFREAKIDTATWDDTFWSHLDTIHLETATTGEYRGEKEKIIFTWFDIALHRSWAPDSPRANLTDGGLLRWRSHANHPKIQYCRDDFGVRVTPQELKLTGRVFSRYDELIKQMQHGDIIVVTLCTRFDTTTNPSEPVSGHLVVSLLDQGGLEMAHQCSFFADLVAIFEVIYRDLVSYGRYRYWATAACKAVSSDPKGQSKIWFYTPPLDDEIISKLHTIQLFTESRDQGWITNSTSASYSWFDLVILRPPEGKTLEDMKPEEIKPAWPKEMCNADPALQMVELVWRSHSNSVGVKQFKISDGLAFGPKHDLLHHENEAQLQSTLED